MSGVKGENSLKLFSDDINTLVQKADEMRDVIGRRGWGRGSTRVSGNGAAETAGVNQPQGEQRYGLMSSDVDAAVQAAIGGLAATQIRYQPK